MGCEELLMKDLAAAGFFWFELGVCIFKGIEIFQGLRFYFFYK